MRSTNVIILFFILSMLVVIMRTMSVQGRIIQRTPRHYAGELPPGYAVKLFLEICQICGHFYGMDHSASCVHDKTFKTFALCLDSVEN